MRFTIRDYRNEDFRTLWEIDQSCFSPGIAYSQFELKSFIRRRHVFTLVAETTDAQPGQGIWIGMGWALSHRPGQIRPMRRARATAALIIKTLKMNQATKPMVNIRLSVPVILKPSSPVAATVTLIASPFFTPNFVAR